MTSNFFKYLLLSGASLGVLATSAQAQTETSPLQATIEIKGQYNYDEGRDLGTLTDNTDQSFQLDNRLRLGYRPSDKLYAYWEGSAVKTWGTASGEDDTGVPTPSGDYLEWRQSYVQFNELFNVIPLNLQVGRQRIREDYGFWWNRDMDAVRLNYDSTLFSGFFAVAQDLFAYRTSETTIDPDSDARLRVLLQTSSVIAPDHRLEFRALYENDHSDHGDIGGIVPAADFDEEDNNLVWGGIRSVGAFPQASGGFLSRIDYRLDAAVVGGSTEEVVTAATADPEIRTVTSIDERDVLGWGLDAGVDVALAAPLNPTLMFGYAYGSGDDGDGTDTAFRQSDLQGNSSRLGLSTASIHNYGEALRPELSNLHVLTAGVSFPMLQASNVTFLYHYYRLANEETGLRSGRVRIATNGTDSDVGQGVDAVFNFDLNKEVPVLNQSPADTDVRVSFGGFKAGDAYDPEDGENMLRGLVQLRVRF